jgi:hypothetical protein
VIYGGREEANKDTLKKFGSMDKSEEGALLLVNQKDEVRVVDEATAFMWDLADGKTLLELKQILANELKGRYNRYEEELLRLIEILRKCNLLGIS